MDNPYQVLGLNPNATEEQIKTAYRELAKQYGGGDYTSDPLADVADSRMDKLNEAYDQIMAERRVGGAQVDSDSGAQSSSSGYSSAYEQSASQNYAEVRQMIRAGDINGAEQRLTAIDSSLRGAEWNYLMGCVCQQRGWLDQCYRYYANANAMEPSNAEYSAAFSRVSAERTQGSASYNPYSGQQGTGMSSCMGGGYPTTGQQQGYDPLTTACQCMCLYSLCNSCCCGGGR